MFTSLTLVAGLLVGSVGSTTVPTAQTATPIALLREASRTCALITDEGVRSVAFGRIGEFYARSGDERAARHMIRFSPQGETPPPIPMAIAMARFHAKGVPDAISIIQEFDNQDARDLGLIALAEDAMSRGDFAAGILFCHAVPTPGPIRALLVESEIYAQKGEMTSCQAILSAAERSTHRPRDLAAIVLTECRVGEIARAIDLASHMGRVSGAYRSEAIGAIARAKAGNGEYAEADKLAEELNNPIDKSWTTGMIALIRLRREGDDEIALSRIASITHDRLRMDFLRSLAAAVAKDKSAQRAHEIALGLKDISEKAACMSEVAIAMSDKNDPELRKLLDEISGLIASNGDAMSDAGLSIIGPNFAQVHRYRDAVNACLKMRNPSWRAKAIQDVAAVAFKERDAADLADIIAEEPDAFIRTSALIGMAEGLLARKHQ